MISVVIVLCFVVRYFMSILVLQSSSWGRESWLLSSVADPGPPTLEALDRWTPAVNILQTLIAQISLHTYRQETRLAYTAPLSNWSYGLREDLSFFLFKLKQIFRASDHSFTYREH